MYFVIVIMSGFYNFDKISFEFKCFLFKKYIEFSKINLEGYF